MNQHHTSAPPQQRPRYVIQNEYNWTDGRWVATVVYDTMFPDAWVRSDVTVQVRP